MKNIFKILLWALMVAIVGYLVFGRSKKEVVAPSLEVTGGPAGERAELGDNLDQTIEVRSTTSE